MLVALAQAAPSVAPANNHLSPNLKRVLPVVQAFRSTVTGPKEILANWTGNDYCEWKGFFCAETPENVTGLAVLDFNNLKLTGNLKLAGFVDKLPDLAYFHLRENSFSGPIPELSQLQYLYEIDLGDNKYSGPFPQSLAKLQGLAYLDLSWNQFSGPIAPELFTTLREVDSILLNNNIFSGRIPNTIGSFAGTRLWLHANKFSGPIPPSIAQVKNATEIVLLKNQLTGSIPTGIGAIPNLETFDASYNQLTGPVPEDLCASKSLKNIILTGNKLDKKLGPQCTKAKARKILQI
jgi:Leucine-rich repeat (LRR) protein